ncbi:hypothetical protein [Paraburkholderia youngii]|uniref:hypothetical protein n=1 Tax=Paraburkholderia youngii TaxID=2782701 RepID=UPI003D25F59E
MGVKKVAGLSKNKQVVRDEDRPFMNCLLGIDLHAWLECAPPLIAIVLEISPLPSKQTVEKHIEELVDDVGPVDESMQERLGTFAEGIVSAYSLTPTALAFIATILTFRNDAASVAAIFFVIVVGLMVYRFLAGRGLYELAGRFRTPRKIYDFTFIQAIRRLVISVNLILIAVLLFRDLFAHGTCEQLTALDSDAGKTLSFTSLLVASEIILALSGVSLLLVGKATVVRITGIAAVVAVIASATHLHYVASRTALPPAVGDVEGNQYNRISSDQNRLEAAIIEFSNRFQASLERNSPKFQVRHLLKISAFLPSESYLDERMTEKIESEVCTVVDGSLKNDTSGGALLFLIGATDRTPLGPHGMERYGSNVGLAQARAEAVRTFIQQKCSAVAAKVEIVAAVNGPRITPQVDVGDSGGLADDRSVDIWGIWASQENENKTAPAHKTSSASGPVTGR